MPKVKIFRTSFRQISNSLLGAKELSRVIYSAERGKLETVLLKPGANANKGLSSFDFKIIKFHVFLHVVEESPPKVPRVTSLSSSTLASMGGPATGGKLKPSFHGKKSKHKDESNVRSPTLKFVDIFLLLRTIHLISFCSVVQRVLHPHKVI